MAGHKEGGCKAKPHQCIAALCTRWRKKIVVKYYWHKEFTQTNLKGCLLVKQVVFAIESYMKYCRHDENSCKHKQWVAKGNEIIIYKKKDTNLKRYLLVDWAACSSLLKSWTESSIMGITIGRTLEFIHITHPIHIITLSDYHIITL